MKALLEYLLIVRVIVCSKLKCYVPRLKKKKSLKMTDL